MSKVIGTNLYDCEACKISGMEHSEMLKHIETVHEISTKNLKGTRTVVMHADGRDYYKWVYRWTFEADNKLEIIQTITNRRTGKDKKMWAMMDEI